MSSSSQAPTMMQPPRSNYSSRNPSARGILQQPQGARPRARKVRPRQESSIDMDDNTCNTASSTQSASPSRQVRPLPVVPTPPPDAHSRTLQRTESFRDIRPLPSCPAPPLKNQSAPASTSHFVASTSFSPPVSSKVGNRFEPEIHNDDSLRDMQFSSPWESVDLDYTSEDDEEASIVEGVRLKRVDYPEYHRMFADKAISRQPTFNPPPTKKWVKETKGNRITVEDYRNVIQLLRAL